MWLTAAQALKRLNGKPQSLYASVSRGRIRAKADPSDSRRSLYYEADVDRLAARGRGRRKASALAAEAIDWGAPLLVSAITTIEQGRLFYRGIDAVGLAEEGTLEEVAALLWDGPRPVRVEAAAMHVGGLVAARERIVGLMDEMPPSAGRAAGALREDADRLFGDISLALAGGGDEPLHRRLAWMWRRPEAADVLRRALVLLADHELNASTFAARVAVSTGASLAAGMIAGLATLSGPRHGGAASAVRVLAEDVGSQGARATEALADWLGEGRGVPGFGHRLYPEGDIRARALLAHLEVPAAYADLAHAAAEVADEAPNVDFALAALTACYDLPVSAPATVFALARSVGWLAHMLEQAGSGDVIRPRARYVGAPPTAP